MIAFDSQLRSDAFILPANRTGPCKGIEINVRRGGEWTVKCSVGTLSAVFRRLYRDARSRVDVDYVECVAPFPGSTRFISMRREIELDAGCRRRGSITGVDV